MGSPGQGAEVDALTDKRHARGATGRLIDLSPRDVDQL